MVLDYYSMLGVAADADRAAIEAALARSQPAWSSGTRNPKNKHTFQSYLDEIPNLRRDLLGDPATRAAYDAELAAARRVDRDQKLDQLQRLVRLRAAKGGLTVADRTLLRAESDRLGLLPADLDRLTALVPPKPEAPSEADDAPDPPLDTIDAVTRRQVRIALEHLRRRDLYDALGLPRDAPLEEVAARADAERRRWMHKAQVTAEKTAWLEIVSLAQSHLNTPAARARYDRTLALEVEETLKGTIVFALKGLSRLDPGSLQALIDEAAAVGVAPDRADRLIGRACRNLGVSRDAGLGSAPLLVPPRLLRCRSCEGISNHSEVAGAKDSTACRHCGASLQWTCPACKRSRWVDEPRCPCGVRIEHAEPIARHFEAARHAFRTRDHESALAHLQRVQELAPQHAEARQALEKLKDRRMEIEQARAASALAAASGRLVAAREALEAWGRLVDPSHTDFQAAREPVARGLRDARALAARAGELADDDPKAARVVYRKALAIASDLPEALDGLKQVPPDPPANLFAEFVGDRVRLRWVAPEADGLGPLSYVVVRKTNAALTHARDGERIAEVAGTEYEDARIVMGAAVAYGVRSKRGAAESRDAVAVGPIALLGAVTDVRVETASRAVDLFWTTPAKAVQVRVARRQGRRPTGPNDGDRIEADRDEAHDRAVEDDVEYHYGLFAVYTLPDGRHAPAPGAFISVRPHPPIAALAAPALATDHDGRVRLSWEPPVRGIVKVLRTPQPLPHAAGDRLTAADVAALPGDWLGASGPAEAVDLDPPEFGACRYTPLTVWSALATVGHEAVYSCVPDPSDLRAQRAGNGKVQLRWSWSPKATETLIVARAGGPPTGPGDPEARVVSVAEGEYTPAGYSTLNLPATDRGPWHIRVYSVVPIEGAPLVSPGLDPSALTVVPGPNPEVTVAYTFHKPKFRPWSLTFQTQPAGAPVPPTVLVIHPRTLPLAADDGTIVHHFPATTGGTTFPLPPTLDLVEHRARVFLDPATDLAALAPLRLHHPETATTRA